MDHPGGGRLPDTHRRGRDRRDLTQLRKSTGADAGALRAARAALIGDTTLRGRHFGPALAELLDRTFTDLLAAHEAPAPVAVVALGSYARRELCPGSDIDVMLLSGDPTRVRGRRPRRPDLRGLAEHLWYPLWDAGFVLGHATRTVDETLELAESDLDSLTAILEVRHVAGDPALTIEIAERGRSLARKRRERLVRQLADASDLRQARPGPIAEMLEPDLKDGSGGLRDLQSLEWAGRAMAAERDPDGAEAALVERGYLSGADVDRLASARALLLDLRVALHRVTGTRSDRMALQEQDAVAAAVGAVNADAMARELAATARGVSWVARETWSRLREALVGPGGRSVRSDRVLAEGVVLREGRVVLSGEGPVSAATALEGAVAAAELGAPFDRASLERLRSMEPPTWDVWERAAFLRLLRAGARAVAVFEALDHVGALTRLFPEWEVVRSRPQRNAYHRFTVDRHMLEAVAECALLLDAGDAPGNSFDSVVARACRRPELLLLSALLHDIGKGLPGENHSVSGAEAAQEIVRRMRLDSEAAEIVPWLVRDHLVLAETATRRDLSDEKTVQRFVEILAGDPERLRLLYLLTIGDSRATGPAAWSTGKAALLRDLFARAAAVVEPVGAVPVAEARIAGLVARIGESAAQRHIAALPVGYVRTFDADEMSAHHHLLARGEVAVSCREEGHDFVGITVVAPDRVGLLAVVAGAVSTAGLVVREASLFTTAGGWAVDVFRASDPYGRFAHDSASGLEAQIRDALSGALDVDEAVRARMRNYQPPGRRRGPVEVIVDLEASDSATVVEVHADDEVGLLYRLATVFAGLHADVSVAKVATLGDRVVDVFYVTDSSGRRIEHPDAIAALEAALVDGIA